MIEAAVRHIDTAASAGRPGGVPAGTVLRTVLLPGAGRGLLLLHRGDSGRADDETDVRPGQAARRRARRADVRGGATGRLLQHRRRDRRRRPLPRQAPQEPHPAGQGVLGEVLLPARQPGLPDLRHRRGPDRRVHLLRAALPGGLAGSGPGRRADRVQPVGDQSRPVAVPVAAGADPRPPSPTSTSSARSTGSAWNRWATTTSTARAYFVDPRGQLVGDAASDTDDEVVVRDLDMGTLAEVRDLWAFYRDRRPETYTSLVRA